MQLYVGKKDYLFDRTVKYENQLTRLKIKHSFTIDPKMEHRPPTQECYDEFYRFVEKHMKK